MTLLRLEPVTTTSEVVTLTTQPHDQLALLELVINFQMKFQCDFNIIMLFITPQADPRIFTK